jgi:hypothetical protein
MRSRDLTFGALSGALCVPLSALLLLKGMGRLARGDSAAGAELLLATLIALVCGGWLVHRSLGAP